MVTAIEYYRSICGIFDTFLLQNDQVLKNSQFTCEFVCSEFKVSSILAFRADRPSALISQFSSFLTIETDTEMTREFLLNIQTSLNLFDLRECEYLNFYQIQPFAVSGTWKMLNAEERSLKIWVFPFKWKPKVLIALLREL